MDIAPGYQYALIFKESRIPLNDSDVHCPMFDKTMTIAKEIELHQRNDVICVIGCLLTAGSRGWQLAGRMLYCTCTYVGFRGDER